jgi:glycerate 2-kinase
LVRPETASLKNSSTSGDSSTSVARLRADMDALVAAAIRACDAHQLTLRAIARHQHVLPPHTSLRVVAAGKAARSMLRAFHDEYPRRIGSELVASHETGAGHPEPNETSVTSGRRALALGSEARRRGEPFVVLLSGGASAMLAVPAAGLTLDDKVRATRVLLGSGLPIAAMNGIRKHLSAIKGGRLAASAGQTITFAISDVHAPVEDDPAVIGSGPTVADASSFAGAVEALRDARVLDVVPAAVRDHLVRGAAGERDETIKSGDPRLARSEFFLAGSRRDAMDGVVAEARERGYDVVRVDPPTLGEARDAARAFVADLRRRATAPASAICVVASGETTVRIEGKAGLGGRNQEFALAAAAELASLDRCALASVGTDGIDGPTDAAGAIVDSTTVARAAALGLDAAAALSAHDSHSFFRALGDLVITGPTGTNVGDVQIFLAGRRG